VWTKFSALGRFADTEFGDASHLAGLNLEGRIEAATGKG
jgi:hypothetical protein